MRYLFSLACLLFLACALPAQTPTKQGCQCYPVCDCTNCNCAAKPVQYVSADREHTDADAAAALALALSQVRSISPQASNYASMRTLAEASKQRLVVGVNCSAPEGERWLTARAGADDGFPVGQYIVVSFWKNG